MFTRAPAKTKLDKAIDVLLDRLAEDAYDSDAYAKMVDQLSKLYKLKEQDSRRRVSPDTLAMIAGNIVGIVLIIGHERANVITTKALGFVMRLK